MTKRIGSLDLARGTAMLFVCLAHFSMNYIEPWRNSSASPLLRWSGQMAVTISMIASPTFMVMSGMVAAYLYAVDRAGMPALRRKLIDRGLFLLLIGHPLLAIPPFVLSHKLAEALQFAFITDVIAIAIVIGPSLMMSTSQATRLCSGIVLLLLSWTVLALPVAHDAVVATLSRYAFGATPDGVVPGYVLVPWLGLYFLATVLGEQLGARARMPGARSKLLASVGASAIALAVAIRGLVHIGRMLAPVFMSTHGSIDGFLAAGQKFPPGPVYLLFFGGCGMLVTSLAFAMSSQGRVRSIVWAVGSIGRASFFVYVLQQYVYYLALPGLALPFRQVWPLYYAFTVLFFVGAAAIWNAFDGNRFLTVGLWRAVPAVRVVRTRLRTALASR